MVELIQASLGLPRGVKACLFDLDGVLTRTAIVHASAWKEMFDEYLGERARRDAVPFVPFDAESDYGVYVDGKVRADGTRAFLASRGIELPEGTPEDPPQAETVNGLGNRKNVILLRRIRQDGVDVYEGSRTYLDAVRRAGLATAVVSASANAEDILRVTGLDQFLDLRVDGVVARRDHLAGKPAPDTFLEAARRLGVGPEAAAVFEDALAGVEAGAAGGFAIVVGVDRVGQREALHSCGADVVVTDLAELLVQGGAR